MVTIIYNSLKYDINIFSIYKYKLELSEKTEAVECNLNLKSILKTRRQNIKSI